MIRLQLMKDLLKKMVGFCLLPPVSCHDSNYGDDKDMKTGRVSLSSSIMSQTLI